MHYSDQDFYRIAREEGSQVIPDEPYRDEFRRDFARILHSPSFRRLVGKTQLFPGQESDFFRNILTHSLEVAQIGKSIVFRLNHELEALGRDDLFIDPDLVESACLAHDLGHPPFGHQGEEALDELMDNFGGFEGNAQTLRILTRLEKKVVYPSERNPPDSHTGFNSHGVDRRAGLNLTLRTILAILKYDLCIPNKKDKRERVRKIHGFHKVIKGYYLDDKKIVSYARKILYKSRKKIKTIECQIMDLADDISYSVYDIEDSFKGGFIQITDLLYAPNEVIDTIANKISIEQIRNCSNSLILKVVQKVSEELGIDSSDDSLEYLRDQRKGIELWDDSELFLLKRIIVKEILIDILDPYIPKFSSPSPVSSATFAPAEEITPESLGGIVYGVSKQMENNGFVRSEFTSRLVGEFIRSIEIYKIDNDQPISSKIFINNECDFNGYRILDTELKIFILKRFTYEFQISSPKLKIVEYRGKEIVKTIFNSILDSNGEFLPDDFRRIYKAYESKYKITESYYQEIKDDDTKRIYEFDLSRMRLICDFVASMTDRYAIEYYSRIKSEEPQSIFKKF